MPNLMLIFNTAFKNIGFDKVKDFVIGQVAYSNALNPRIARLLEILHIACQNHCLYLACNDIEEHDTVLKVQST